MTCDLEHTASGIRLDTVPLTGRPLIERRFSLATAALAWAAKLVMKRRNQRLRESEGEGQNLAFELPGALYTLAPCGPWLASSLY